MCSSDLYPDRSHKRRKEKEANEKIKAEEEKRRAIDRRWAAALRFSSSALIFSLASFSFLLLWLLSGYLFLSSGNPIDHGSEPSVARTRPECSAVPRARVSSSLSLSGMNRPSRASLFAFLRASMGRGFSWCLWLYMHNPSASNVPPCP